MKSWTGGISPSESPAAFRLSLPSCLLVALIGMVNVAGWYSHWSTLAEALPGVLPIELARATFPDVILMDINLPGISGTRALEILRHDPSMAKIPVIALSANAMPRDIAKGLAAGFSSYLTKPIKFKEFEDAFTKALSVTAGQPMEEHHDQLIGYS